MLRKKSLAIIVVLILVFSGVILAWWLWPKRESDGFIKVGVLNSFTGPSGTNEKNIAEATLFAIEEINDNGGVLGKKILPIVADAKSDWPTFAKEAERLITEEKVVVIFGCTTSASRKLVKDVVEKYNNLLFYPVQYEGLESSPNIVYLGATANQQAIPAVNWSLENLGTRLFLIGSDYIYQHVVNGIIRDLIKSRGGTIVGEAYIPVSNYDVKPIVKKVIDSEPQVIISSIVGPANADFFNALRSSGVSTEKMPSVSLSVMEMDLRIYDLEHMLGDYGVQNYFESLDTQANKEFVAKFKQRFGEDIGISNNMENAYTSVYLWRNTVNLAKSTKTNDVRRALGGYAMSTPEGIVSVDGKNQHLWKPFLVGKILPNRQFGIVWNSISTVKPVPYPSFRTKEQWEELVTNLYNKWGHKWWR
jgi:urea transport system substrate-binding protein